MALGRRLVIIGHLGFETVQTPFAHAETIEPPVDTLIDPTDTFIDRADTIDAH